MDTLKYIDISRNRVTSLESNDFSKFRRLQVLDMSANGIELFPLQLKKCENLKELRLINNKIEEVPCEFFEQENIQRSL